MLFEGMSLNKGGLETYIINVYNALNKNNYRFFFIAYDKEIAYEKYLKNTGAEVIHVTSRSVNPYRYIKELANIFKRNRIDVFWAHKTTLSLCEAMILAKKYKVPVRMIHSHSSENMGGKFTYIMHNLNKKFIRKEANVFLACSEVASKWFYGDKKSIIMRNAINLERFKFDPKTRSRIRNELMIEDKFVVGHVGAFNNVKNHNKLLHIFKSFHEQEPNSILLLCGDGELRKDIENTIHELQIDNSVILLGMIDNVNEVLQAFDIYVMPSLFEGLPFSIMEALASGLICIVSDTISQESNVIGRNVSVGLDASNVEWVNIVRNFKTPIDRFWGYEEMKKCGFDIKDNVAKIELIINKKLQK